jgi:hypothetical protein
MDADNDSVHQDNQPGPINPPPNAAGPIWRFDAPPATEEERSNQLIAEYLLIDVDEPPSTEVRHGR